MCHTYLFIDPSRPLLSPSRKTELDSSQPNGTRPAINSTPLEKSNVSFRPKADISGFALA
jgi:hypothetical protein